MRAMRFRRMLLLAVAMVVCPGLAAAQPDTEPGMLPLIIRGSSSAPEASVSESVGSGVVLRGTPPPVAPPAPIYACAPGYLPDPSLGCVVSGVAYAPNDLDYWPYVWPYDAYVPRRRFGPASTSRRFGHRVARLGRAERFGRR